MRGRRANVAPPAHPSTPDPGEGWSANNGESPQRPGPHHPCHSHEAVTLSNENALSRFRACSSPLSPACGPQRAAHGPGQGSQGGCPPYVGADARPTQALAYPLAQPGDPFPLVMPPSGGVERTRRAVRFARLIDRRVRDLGGPAARATFGGNLSLPWLLRRVVRHAA